jgi:hypothetical protein
MTTYRCSYPPCQARSTDTRAELQARGWTFRTVGGVREILCPLHNVIQSLF